MLIRQFQRSGWMNSIFKILDKQIEMERDGENNHTKNKVHWNSNKITPGTNFMDKLTKKLNVFKEYILS